MVSKETNNNTTEKEKSKYRKWIVSTAAAIGHTFYDTKLLRKERRKELIEALLEYAKSEEDGISFMRFLKFNNIHPGRWHEWKDKYPDFAQAHKTAMRYIGDNREVKAVNANPSLIYKTQEVYDPDYEKLLDRDAKRKQVANTPDIEAMKKAYKEFNADV